MNQKLSVQDGLRRIGKRYGWLAIGLLITGCGGPTERPDRMVPLATVQSGPHIQAQELDGAITRQPGNASLYARRAAFRLDAGQVEAALQDINQALDLDDGPGEFYFTKARALRAQYHLTAALEAAADAARHGFASPELNLLVGEANLATRHYQAALDQLDRVLQQEPDHVAALFYKGLAFAATGDTTQAVDYLRASLLRDPRQSEILHQLAFLLNAYHRPDQGARYAARGLQLDPNYAPLLYDYARQFELQAAPDSALRYYAQALQQDSTLYRADYHLGELAYAQRRYPVAIPALQRALRRAPRLPEARQQLAESLENIGRYAEAQAQYRQLVAENPSNRHWTYKVWKTGERARGFSGDTTTRSRVSAVAPLAPRPTTAGTE